MLFSVGLADGLSPFVISDAIFCRTGQLGYPPLLYLMLFSVGLRADGLSPFVISDAIFCRTGSSWVIPLCYI